MYDRQPLRAYMGGPLREAKWVGPREVEERLKVTPNGYARESREISKLMPYDGPGGDVANSHKSKRVVEVLIHKGQQ